MLYSFEVFFDTLLSILFTATISKTTKYFRILKPQIGTIACSKILSRHKVFSFFVKDISNTVKCWKLHDHALPGHHLATLDYDNGW